MAAPSLRKRPSSVIIFALIRRRADDEKTPSKARQENLWWVKSTPLWAHMCKPPSRAQRMFTSSTGVKSDRLRLYTASAANASCMITGLL